MNRQHTFDLSQIGADLQRIDVVRDAVAAFPGFDAVALLQPTSPLRTGEDIAGALALMGNSQAVVSVTETRHPEVYTINPLQRLRPLDIGTLLNDAIQCFALIEKKL